MSDAPANAMEPDSLGAPALDRVDGRSISFSEEERAYRNAAIDFRHLRYFVTVAELLHFRRAAEALFITQPALSQAIARLESSLDVPLLRRNRHNVELTPAGTELLSRGRRLLADKDEAIDRVRRLGNGSAGVFRVGVAMLAEHDIGPALSGLAFAEPALLVDRSAAVSERLLEQLRAGRLDAAFVHQVPALMAIDEVAWELVRVGRLAALMQPAHRLGESEVVRLEDLREETFLVNPRELAPSAYEGLKLMCQHYGGFEPKLRECPAASTLPLGLDSGLFDDGGAIAVMTEHAARAAPASHAVVPIMPPPTFALAMAWRRGDTSPLLSSFLEFVRSFRDEHGWSAQS